MRLRVAVPVGALLLLADVSWIYYGLVSSSKHGLVVYHLVAIIVVICLLAGVLALVILKQRKAAIALAGISAIFVVTSFIPRAYFRYRIGFTRERLEEAYDSLASTIGDLPSEPFAAPRSPHMLSHGYWRDPDGSRFELFYHIGSDSYVLRYPKKRWEWRGYNYRGPEAPSSPATPHIGSARQVDSHAPALREKAKRLFLVVADGPEEEARSAVTELYRMCKEGRSYYYYWSTDPSPKSEPYRAVTHFVFYPVARRMMGIVHIVQYRSASETIQRAAPRMIALMEGGQQKEIDYLLRALQGRSPEGKDPQSWKVWWDEYGHMMFKVPAEGLPAAVKVVEEPAEP